MTDPEWLDGYSGETTDQLLALKDSFRVDSIVLAFEEALGQKAERLGFSSLSEEELVVLAVEALEREVNNGGYDQFFFNSPEFVPLAVNALNKIGCSQAAELTREAIACLCLPEPITRAAIEQAMEQDSEDRDERLERCDDKYYEVVGDLADSLLQYIEEHKNRIAL